jgi:hypothetical protein
MRLGINLDVAGAEDRKSVPIQRPMTTTMYLNYISNLRLNEQIKDKFKALVFKMPSPALRSVITNLHEYTRRFETEVHQELMGTSTFINSSVDTDEMELFATPEYDPVEMAVKETKFKLTIEKEAQHGTSTEEGDQDKVQIKWVNACEGENQSGPDDQYERQNHRFHADLSDGTICHGGLSGELHTGREQSKEDGSPFKGERDARLRTDTDGTTGI